MARYASLLVFLEGAMRIFAWSLGQERVSQRG